MALQPNLYDVHLESCCVRSLEKINDILSSNKILQNLMIPAVFASCFVGPNVGSSVTTFYSIGSTDWALLAEASIRIGDFARHEITNICADEYVLIHSTGKLHKFWKAMYDSFC